MGNRIAAVLRLAILAAGFALGGCDDDVQYASAASGSAAAQARDQGPRPRIAVTHAYVLNLRQSEVPAIQQAHLAKCREFGCTVLNTRLDRANERRIYAHSSVRISPDAFDAFVAIITAAPLEMVVHSETAEDKSLPLLDVEKRLEVKTALRDRLRAMLADPEKKSAGDLATIEKELAQVQGDIEAAIAQHEHLKSITETIKLDITYQGVAAQAGGFDLSPIDRSIKGFSFTIVNSVGNLVWFVAAIIPWTPLIVAIAWLIRVGLRRWKSTRAPAS